MRRLMVWVAVLGMVLGMVPGVGVATHGGVHGYCEGDTPVVVEWPEKYEDHYHPVCEFGEFYAMANDPLGVGVAGPETPEPDDFFNWAIIYLNETRMVNPYKDVYPYVTKSTGRTLIPIRMVTEAMGGTAEWDNEKWEVTIRLGDKYMIMTIGSSHAIANGEPIVLDQPPLLFQSRTMVPIRVIMEAFGAQVGWTPESQRVDITLPGVTCAEGYCVE